MANAGPATQLGGRMNPRRYASRARNQSFPMFRRNQWNLKIGTWNISSIKHKEADLVEEAIRYKLDLIGLSSTKRQGAEAEPIDVHRGWKLYMSGVPTTVRAQAGVGILLSPHLASCWTEWTPISGRVALLRIHLPEGKKLAIVQAYAPNTEREYAAFLDELDSTFSRIPSTESLILMGDFNAHVGDDASTWSSVIGRQGDPHINNSGRMFLDFCAGTSLSIMNTFFAHKQIHKFSWYRDAVGQKSIIDFIIVSADLKRSVQDVRVKRGAELSTDHHLVVASIRCNGRQPTVRRGKIATRIKWEELNKQEVQQRMASKMEAQLHQVPVSTADTETEWNLFKLSLLAAATKVCGTKRVGMTAGGHQRTPWWTPEVKQAVAKKKQTFKLWIQGKTPQNLQQYQDARRDATRVVAEAKALSIELFGKNLTANYHSAIKVFYQTLKRMRRKGGGSVQHIKDNNGIVLAEDSAILERWKEYFSMLLNPAPEISEDPPPSLLLPNLTTTLTTSEVTQALQSLKSGKSGGIDEIRPEMLKALTEPVVRVRLLPASRAVDGPNLEH